MQVALSRPSHIWKKKKWYFEINISCVSPKNIVCLVISIAFTGK